jgi:hypothetical protein
MRGGAMTDNGIHPVHITQTSTATVRCAEGHFAENAIDAAEVSTVLGHGAMHAMTSGHQAREHVNLDLTVMPE